MAPTTTQKRDGVRGVPLVEKIVAELKKSREIEPHPVAADVLATLTLAEGQPLPPSLRAFLAFDGTTLLGDGEPLTLPPPTRPSVIAREMGLHDDVSAFDRVLPGACYPLAVVDRSDARYFLYAGKPDAAGELPVFSLDGDAALSLQAPGIDVFLADWFGVIEFDGWHDRHYGDAITEQSQLNFAGNLELEPGSAATYDDGDDSADADDSDEEPDEPAAAEAIPTDGKIVAALAREFGYADEEADAAVTYVGRAIAAALDAGNPVQFPGLGQLTTVDGRTVVVREPKMTPLILSLSKGPSYN